MSAATNILRVAFGAARVKTTAPLYQYDYGQKILFTDLDLPTAYTVDFAAAGSAMSYSMLGDDAGVLIPDVLLQHAGQIDAYLFLHAGDDDGETEYTLHIPVTARQARTDEEPTPVQRSYIEQAIVALNDAVEATGIFAQEAGAQADRAEAEADLAEGSATTAASAAADAAAAAERADASAASASQSAATALASQNAAAQSASAASASQSAAAVDADRAEQAAAQAGYMFFHIDENGDLIYQRTTNVQADFYLDEGDLYIKAVG